MVGSDESTELWRHPKICNYLQCNCLSKVVADLQYSVKAHSDELCLPRVAVADSCVSSEIEFF